MVRKFNNWYGKSLDNFLENRVSIKKVDKVFNFIHFFLLKDVW